MIDDRTLANVHYTKARHEWLSILRDEQCVSRRGRGRCPYDCAQMGWTQWRDPTEEHAAREELTDSGIKVLAFWDQFRRKP